VTIPVTAEGTVKATTGKSVDQYLASQPEPARKVLTRVRAIVRKALPGADEVISYQIPAYKLYGTYVVYFAGWKKHYSLYPVTDRAQAALGDELRPYEVSKGTVRFPLDQPMPVKLIGRIVKLLATEARNRVTSRTRSR
jgi:uncharacterized protein YdhG (YjbR/CyaY superfamily)